MTAFYTEAMKASGLRPTQFTMLSAIMGHGEITINDLSEFLVMDQTTVTRNVNVLKKAGYIKVSPGNDKRTRLVSLTPEGSAIRNEAYPLWLAAQEQLWNNLGHDKAAQLLALVDDLIALDEPLDDES
ncbi:MAG: MarR family winged helix-turn-helix transcriptional regulator [Deinococcota bacterium]